ncbi:hypothetical protein CDIK_0546 [Cucumispora dikerogammari]|nr:hypothetical protein CDIK_0546 [Cucumispora dikerogammari]
MEVKIFNKETCSTKKRSNKISTLNLLFSSPSLKYLFLIKHSKNYNFVFSTFFTLKKSIIFNKSSFIPNLKFVTKFKENNLFISETFDFFSFFDQKSELKFQSIIFLDIKLDDFQIEFLNEFSCLNKIPVFIYSETIDLNRWKVNLLNPSSLENVFTGEVSSQYNRTGEIYFFNNKSFTLTNYRINLPFL